MKRDALISYLGEAGMQKYPVATMAVMHHRSHRGDRLDFTNRPFLPPIYRDLSDDIVILKASQSGISEYLIVYAINESRVGRNVLYVLPTYGMMGSFVRTRIDPTVNFTPFYKQLAQKLVDAPDSTALKRFGSGFILFVGAQTPNAFISHPVDTIIVDEVDQCDEQNLALAPSRLSASKHKKTVNISNPTIEGVGVDFLYGRSDKKRWTIKHDCGNWIVPDFFKHVVQQCGSDWMVMDPDYTGQGDDIRPVCDKCGKPFDRFAPGEWVSERKSDVSGYQINKIFSSNDTIPELVDRYGQALSDDRKMMAFYNMDLGLGYTPRGAKIDEQMVFDCIGTHQMGPPDDGVTIIGMDVGKVIHTLIGKPLPDGRVQIVFIGELNTAEDVMDHLRKYRVKVGVIDALPETRLSRGLTLSHPGMFMSIYTSTTETKVQRNKTVHSDRTMALDAVKEALGFKHLILPANAKTIPGFVDQLTSSTRVLVESKSGDRDRHEWREGAANDHYHHALAYMLIAKKLVNSLK